MHDLAMGLMRCMWQLVKLDGFEVAGGANVSWWHRTSAACILDMAYKHVRKSTAYLLTREESPPALNEGRHG